MGRFAKLIDSPPLFQIGSLQAVLQYSIPADVAGGHVQAQGPLALHRRCEGNRIGPEKGTTPTVALKQRVRVSEGKADQPSLCDEVREISRCTEMGGVTDRCRGDSRFAGALRYLQRGHGACGVTEGVVCVESRHPG